MIILPVSVVRLAVKSTVSRFDFPLHCDPVVFPIYSINVLTLYSGGRGKINRTKTENGSQHGGVIKKINI